MQNEVYTDVNDIEIQEGDVIHYVDDLTDESTVVTDENGELYLDEVSEENHISEFETENFWEVDEDSVDKRYSK